MKTDLFVSPFQRSRRAQITIFIVIGLILLLTVATVFYFQYRAEQHPIFALSEDPVTAYVQQCIVDTTKEAVLLAGEHGGAIYQEEYTDKEKKLLELLPFNSEVLFLANGKQQLPYWYYQKSDGIDRVAIPELEKQAAGDGSIQDQLEQYVGNQMTACLNNFAALKNNGIIVEPTENMTVSSVITEKSVEVTVSYPLKITQGDATSSQESFTALVPVGLKRTYALAREIAQHELDTLFLEQTTRNLLVTYGQVKKDYLPPIAGGLRFDPCADRVYWFYNDVQQDVQQMLAANIPYITVANSDNGKITLTSKQEADDKNRKLRQGVFDAFVQYPSENDYSGILANFNYQTNYPMDLYFGNHLGYGLIQPNALEINILIANLCMFDYSFLYNLKFPVVVTLVDTDSNIDGNSFVFQFSMEVIVKNNYPRIKLNDVLRDTYRIPETSEDSSYQCDPTQRLSGQSTITVQDPKGASVENAVVNFQCGPSYVYEYDVNGTISAIHQFAETCFMGTTDVSGQLTTAYPPCVGAGFVTIKDPAYLEKSVSTGNIFQGTSFDKTIVLDKVYTREVALDKYFVAPPSPTNTEGIGVHLDENGNVASCNVNQDAKELFPYESAIITLTKLDPENGVLNAIPLVAVDGGSTEPASIEVAPGQYYVDIMLLREERYPGEMTIKAKSEAIQVPSTIGTDIISYPDDDVLIPQTFTGGAAFLWNVTAGKLESGNTIHFGVFDEGAPNTVEQVSAPLAHRQGCSNLHQELILPYVR